MSERPEWMKPGVEVAYLRSSGMHETVRFATIDRVLKRDVVLSDGERFNADTQIKRGNSSWDAPMRLYPRDHDRIAAAVERNQFYGKKHAIRKALEDANLAVNYAETHEDISVALTKLVDELGGDA